MIAQVIGSATEPYLSQASLASDGEIYKQMEGDGNADQTVVIRVCNVRNRKPMSRSECHHSYMSKPVRILR